MPVLRIGKEQPTSSQPDPLDIRTTKNPNSNFDNPRRPNMPIRRRDDGEIVEEPTEPGSGKRSEETTDAERSRPGHSPRKDSLFGPQSGDTGGVGRLEESTVPMRRGREDDHTRIVTPRRGQAGAMAETEMSDSDPMRDPPVGWLVVVRGPGKGSVLTLGNGMNVLGRGPDVRVRIDFGDDTIGRANHARVAYEPRQRRYLLNHGDGSNLTYLNGKVVMGATEIESGAMIELGETTLRFQAFCSTDFDWPDVDD